MNYQGPAIDYISPAIYPIAAVINFIAPDPNCIDPAINYSASVINYITPAIDYIAQISPLSSLQAYFYRSPGPGALYYAKYYARVMRGPVVRSGPVF